MNIHTILDYCMHSPLNTNKIILEQLLQELGGTHDGRFTIKQVVDYVMYTRHNTNRAVLETMLRNMKGHTPTPEPPTPQTRTVLYADGTFIMNELPGDAQANESTHGVVVNEYPPLDASHNYVFMRDADRPWHSDVGQIKSVKFGSFVAPTSTSKWFSGCTRLTTFDATNLSTEDTTDMGDMFNSCSSLTDFDMTVLDLSSTTTVQQMFSRCLNLRHINLENINTSNIEKFTSMFQGCTNLATIDLSYFDTSNAKTIAGMFWGCSSLTELNVSSFDTTNITGMGNVFNGCTGLTELDLSNFDTSKVTTIVAMFSNCSNLTTIYVSDKFVTTAVTSTGQVFQGSMNLVGGAGTAYDNLQLGKDYARIDNPPDEPGYFTLKMPKKRTVLYEDGTLILNELETDIAENERVHGIATNVYPPMDENNDYVFASLEDRPWHGERATIVKAEIGSPMQPTSTAYWFGLFSHCNHIDVYGLDTSQVTSMAGMFSTTAVETLDLSEFDTSNVTNMYQMFTNNTRLTELDLSSFDTSKVTDTRMMFMACSSLKTVYASDAFDISSLTTAETAAMFQWCNTIVGGDGTAYNALKINGEYARIDNLPDTPGYFTRKNEGRRTVLFTDGTLIINQLPMRKSMDIALHGAEVKVYPAFSAEHPYVWVSDTEVYWHAERTQIKAVNIGSAIAPTSTSNWFDGCSSLETFTGSVILNTSNTNDMSYMFRDCKALTSVDLSHCNVANVITMANMFSGCDALTTVNVSTFTTTKLRNMGGMFMGCGALTTVDLSSFDTSQVVSMNNMFRGCTSLTTLDLSNFDTATVEDMNSLFHSCKALATLDVSGFDTSSVTDMTRMFVECEAFTTLDLTSFDTSKVTLMTDMFKDMINLTTITVDENKFTTAALRGTQAMFHGSTKLVGGAGTRYDSSKYDSRFAVVDSPPTAPGYFTGVPTKRTVLYTDGTFIINEKLENSAENERTHGAATNIYPPFDAEHNYVFNSYADRYWQSKTSSIKKVEFGSEMQPTSMRHWFRSCEALTTFDWTNLDTSEVEDMSYLFMNCNAIQNMDLTSFNTSKVASMYNMFFGCIKMTSIDVSSFDTESVLIFDSMFYNCYEIETIDLSNFNTSNATNLSFMFYGCSKLKNVDLSSFETVNVEDMDSMFYECTKLKTLDLSSFNTQGLTNLESMFGECVNLETIYASDMFDATHTGSERVFTRCVKLVGGEGTIFDATFIDADYAHIDKGESNPGYLTNKPSKRTVLYNDNTLIINELTKDSAENQRIHGAVIKEYEPYGPENPYDFNGPEDQPWSGEFDLITSLKFGSEVKPTKVARWFEDLVGLDNIDWTHFDTSEVEDMSRMFYNCITLPDVDLSSLNTSKVQTMESMFEQCHSFTNLDLSGLDTSSVENMSGMFRNCSGLINIDLSDWDNSSAIDMSDMFLACRGLENINLSNFNTSNVKIMNGMFGDCDVLENIDLSSFDTTNVEEMNSMFNKCISLLTLDLSNFNTSKVTTSLQMFKDCSLLKTIYASENLTFRQTYYDQNMFSNCTSLVGGAGTTYNSGYVNKRYACIDNPPTAPGYFTDKNPDPTGYPYTFGTVGGGNYNLLPGAYSFITDNVHITGTPINDKEVGKLTLKNVYANGTSYGDLEADLVIDMTATPYAKVNAIFEKLEYGFHFQIIIMLNPDMSIVHALAMNTNAADSLEISWSEGVFEATGKSV